ncbi:MAG: tRNA (N6-threonylcarbamoyladenosine(37)-N6)-methyltransferase TrmO [Candidatus Portnoybacteria bacterium]|nr:tRNA (N6-threonylcarbamoyladenosine(37)-N6)-methyltransferase TrmO [Candidatus Portnoybacteria bacterium]
MKIKDDICFEPIGWVRNGIEDRERMKDWDKTASQIFVYPQFAEALEGIEQHSHLWILFWMHKIHNEMRKTLKVYSMGFQKIPPMGVFAMRTPFRPNPIGLTLVKLLRRRENVLKVEGLDAIDGTPILDIKPFTGHPREIAEDFKAPFWANMSAKEVLGGGKDARRVHFVTTNVGKFNTFVSDLALAGYDIEAVHENMNLPESRSNIYQIAIDKAFFAYKKLRKPVVVIDAGFYIYALNGRPGVFVNEMLGWKSEPKAMIEKILRLMEGERRECAFVNCLAYYDGTTAGPIIFESRAKGVLAEAPRGNIMEGKESKSWSILDLIFIPEGETKTLAETKESGEYEAWRRKRLENKESCAAKFAEWFLSRN